MADEELMLMLDQLFQAITGTGTVIVTLSLILQSVCFEASPSIRFLRIFCIPGFRDEGAAERGEEQRERLGEDHPRRS